MLWSEKMRHKPLIVRNQCLDTKYSQQKKNNSNENEETTDIG